MAFVAGNRSRVLAGDFHFSPVTADWSHDDAVDTLEVSTINDTAKAFIVGQNTSTFNLSGWLDVDSTADAHFDQMNDWKAGTSAEPVSFAPNGFAITEPVIMVGGLETNFTTGSQVADKVTYSLTGQADGPTDLGKSLKDLSAVTVDTNGTGVDYTTVSTTSGGVAHLHVTAFSGFSGVVFTIADSADNSSFATIGTFTTVAGLTSQRLTITGTVRRYIRYVADVTGTGSVTFAVAFARR